MKPSPPVTRTCSGQAAHANMLMRAMTHRHRSRPPARPDRRGAPDPRGRARHLRRVPRGLRAPEARRRRAADRAVGRARREGLPRREPARGVGRRRARHDRAGHGGRGDRRRGQVAAPDRGVAGDRRATSSPATAPTQQKERWLRGIAAGTTKIAFAITEPDAGTNSHNLATSVERRGDRLRAARPEDLHLGRRARGRGAGGGAQPAAGRLARPAVAGDRGRGHAGLHARRDPDAVPRPRQAVDALLRRRRARGGAADRRRGRRARPGVRRAQPRADHGRRRSRAARAGARSRRRPPTRTSGPSGARRSGPTRACRTRSRRRRSSWSWRG